jgi:vacuolar-type H+-ATPase subunit E/Vma4
VLHEVVPTAGERTGADAPGEDQGDLFDPRAFADRLLDESWREEREAILADARRGAAALRASPGAPTDEALKARLAEALGERVEQLLGEALDELQATLGRVVRREVRRVLDEAFEAHDEPPKPDGTD